MYYVASLLFVTDAWRCLHLKQRNIYRHNIDLNDLRIILDADICVLPCLYQNVHQSWWLNCRQSNQHKQTYKQY